ncbi:cytochrome c oxidase accessory protein CcoG [Candidatus Reidiella endopervernicosa]|nr:cytochrome c oxidase accessory protein CcoG [Candidatus Reidiella endopervernicosa]
MPGMWRNLKWLSSTVWIFFFLGPYLRWDDRQAILLDIPNEKFHILNITILPQDVWMLALVLLFFSILLAAVTSVAGRVYCGFFCFQTIWTDIYTLIEEKLEGGPAKRRKLEKAPWDLNKIRIKTIKHTLWLLIGALTGVTFAAWFTDAYDLWIGYFTFTAPTVAWTVLGLFTVGTYVLAGFMREQTCFWLCPYARIQGVMYDEETVLPTYDLNRGEPRGKLKKGQHVEGMGDCIECNQCVAVCPTGIDIREGQQEGCITCALCIDACDSVMDKINRPRGLIRYASYDEIQGKPTLPLRKRPRVLVYFTIMTLAVVGLVYGLTHLGAIELKVLHDRQPLFVQQSDGSIQNKYFIKLLNKTDADMKIRISATGPEQMVVVGADKTLVARKGRLNSYTLFVRVPSRLLESASTPIVFKVEQVDAEEITAEYTSMFMGPRR